MSNNHYLVAFLSVVGVIAVALFVLGMTHLISRRQARSRTPERVRPARAVPVDLGAHYHEFCSRRDRYEDRHPELTRWAR